MRKHIKMGVRSIGSVYREDAIRKGDVSQIAETARALIIEFREEGIVVVLPNLGCRSGGDTFLVGKETEKIGLVDHAVLDGEILTGWIKSRGGAVEESLGLLLYDDTYAFDVDRLATFQILYKIVGYVHS